MPEDRRHIAVMFTDIVGYTALMGSNEDKAFDTISRIRGISPELTNDDKVVDQIREGRAQQEQQILMPSSGSTELPVTKTFKPGM